MLCRLFPETYFYFLTTYFVTTAFDDDTSWPILMKQHAKQQHCVSCGVFFLKLIK